MLAGVRRACSRATRTNSVGLAAVGIAEGLTICLRLGRTAGALVGVLLLVGIAVWAGFYRGHLAIKTQSKAAAHHHEGC